MKCHICDTDLKKLACNHYEKETDCTLKKGESYTTQQIVEGSKGRSLYIKVFSGSYLKLDKRDFSNTSIIVHYKVDMVDYPSGRTLHLSRI